VDRLSDIFELSPVEIDDCYYSRGREEKLAPSTMGETQDMDSHSYS